MAEPGEGLQALPIGSGQRCAEGAFGLPTEVEDVQVFRPQLVADVGQCGLGAKRGREAVGQVTGDAQSVFGGERTRRDAEQVELHGLGMAGLPAVDPVEVGLQGLPGR